jgi:hypothetical protein
MSLSGAMDERDNSILNMNGHTLSDAAFYLAP